MNYKETTSISKEVQAYYEKVSLNSIDLRIRNTIRKLADEIADEIIAKYELKKLIVKEVSEQGDIDVPKMIIALEIERKIL